MTSDLSADSPKAFRLRKPEFSTWFIIFLISTGLIAIERFSPVYINNFYVRLLLYIVSGSLLAYWVFWILFGFSSIKWRIPIFLCVVALCSGKAYFTWGGDWKTQAIFYTNKKSSRKTIEYQMRGDHFSFGYKDRIVERKTIIPFVDYITDTDTLKLSPDWQRAERTVNEQRIESYKGVPAK